MDGWTASSRLFVPLRRLVLFLAPSTRLRHAFDKKIEEMRPSLFEEMRPSLFEVDETKWTRSSLFEVDEAEWPRPSRFEMNEMKWTSHHDT